MSLRILAVDDSRTIRDMLKLALGQAGFTPQVAEDGLHGLEVLEDMVDEGAPPDAIITDINMPRMDGFGFIDAVRAKDEHRAVPILVLSTESAAELKARARTSGATGWIVKPFDPVKLVKAINMVAGKGAA
ncbi:response regulator [Vannielia litorea]|uniref:Two-component system, chemotaxis family, response regulator CheY n=1 Tax=Vannielia litorea TaxID=1217970 RepID=A0A1N6F300_9RHOB|nr:response regulator [Vannielia litorea]SIN89641.1 two-component system, chemotaxis family, response regulator CheY [Vannielia litorea]